MAEIQKPEVDIVKVAALAMTHPESVTHDEIRRMAARNLDDQRNEPMTHNPNRAFEEIRKSQAKPTKSPPHDRR